MPARYFPTALLSRLLLSSSGCPSRSHSHGLPGCCPRLHLGDPDGGTALPWLIASLTVAAMVLLLVALIADFGADAVPTLTRDFAGFFPFFFFFFF